MDDAQLTRKAIEEIVGEIEQQSNGANVQVQESNVNRLEKPNKRFLGRTINSIMLHNERTTERIQANCRAKLQELDASKRKREHNQFYKKSTLGTKELHHEHKSNSPEKKRSNRKRNDSSSSESSSDSNRRRSRKKIKKSRRRLSCNNNSSSSSNETMCKINTTALPQPYGILLHNISTAFNYAVAQEKMLQVLNNINASALATRNAIGDFTSRNTPASSISPDSSSDSSSSGSFSLGENDEIDANGLLTIHLSSSSSLETSESESSTNLHVCKSRSKNINNVIYISTDSDNESDKTTTASKGLQDTAKVDSPEVNCISLDSDSASTDFSIHESMENEPENGLCSNTNIVFLDTDSDCAYQSYNESEKSLGSKEIAKENCTASTSDVVEHACDMEDSTGPKDVTLDSALIKSAFEADILPPSKKSEQTTLQVNDNSNTNNGTAIDTSIELRNISSTKYNLTLKDPSEEKVIELNNGVEQNNTLITCMHLEQNETHSSPEVDEKMVVNLDVVQQNDEGSNVSIVQSNTSDKHIEKVGDKSETKKNPMKVSSSSN